MTDLKEIINKCVKNEGQAQTALYRLIAPKLLGVCCRYFKNRQEAEDVMQDSLVKIFMNLNKYRFEGSFDAWCKQITVNTALNRLKAEKKIRFDSFDDNTDVMEPEKENEELPDEKLMLECLQTLPEGYRTVVNLYLFEDYSHRQIAIHLGINESTSRSQYTRARQLLSQLIKEKVKMNENKLTRLPND